MRDISRGIICHTIRTTITHTIITQTSDPYDYNGANYNVDQADSAEVQAVQMQLARLGYYNGSIDGVFGPSTRDVVAELPNRQSAERNREFIARYTPVAWLTAGNGDLEHRLLQQVPRSE